MSGEPKALHRWVDRGEVRLWAEEYGGDGPTCLLVGGAGAISAFWPDAFCQGLASSGYRVIRYDHRDAGNSSFVDRGTYPYGLEDLLDDATAILDACGVRTAHVVGHSMGGFVAQLAAIHRPRRLRSITSISSHTASPMLPDPPAETWRVMLANNPVGDLDRDLPGYMKVWRFLNGEAPFDREMASGYTREIYARNPATLPATNHVAVQDGMEDRSPALRGVDLPALVIHGELDPLVPIEGGVQTADALGGSRFVRLAHAGHMFFHGSIWREILDELLSHLSTADHRSPRWPRATAGQGAGPRAAERSSRRRGARDEHERADG